MRLKHRYVVFQIILDSEGSLSSFNVKAINSTADSDRQMHSLTQMDVLNALREKTVELFGDIGSGTFGKLLTLKFFDPENNLFVVRVPRSSQSSLCFAASCLGSIRSVGCICRALEICGSERTCKARLLVVLDAINRVENFSSEEAFLERAARDRQRISALQL
jgi:RNase P/RNase MRP subunit POP5